MSYYDDWLSQQGGGGMGGGQPQGQLSGSYVFPGQSMPKSQPVAQKKKKNFWLDQISTAGGILGGLGGGIAGTVLGPVGTVAGAASGSAAGSGLGQALENIITGDKLNQDVGKETIIGGVTGLPLLKGAKLAVTGGRALLGGGKAAAEQGAEQVAKTSVQGRVANLGDKLLSSQYGTIGKPTARATSPEKTFGTLASYGVTKPADVERIAGKFTGSDGLVNRAVTKSVGNSSRINTDGLDQIFNDAAELNGLVDKDAASARNVYRAQMKKLMGGPSGSINADAHPNDVLDVMKALEKRAADLTGKGGNYRMATPERADQAKTLMAVRDELENRLSGSVDVKKVLTPEFRQQLTDLHPGNKQWQQFVDTQVMGAKDISALRSTMAPFVNARKIVDDADVNSMTFGGRGGDGFQSLTHLLTSGAQKLAQAPLARTAATGLRKVGGAESVAPGADFGMGARIGLAGRVGGAGALQGGIDQLNQQMQPAQGQPQSLEDALMANYGQQQPQMPGGGMQGGGMQQEQSPYSQENLLADVQRDPKHYEDYLTLYKELNPDKGASDKLSATTTNQLTASSNALNTLDQLEQMYSQAGGGSGPVGGTIKNTLAQHHLNNSAQTYNDTAASTVSQLARALNGTGQVSDTDAAVIQHALPNINDSPQVARAKFQALKARLLAAQQNAAYYGSPDDTTLQQYQ